MKWNEMSPRRRDALVAEYIMGAMWWRSSTTGRRALFIEQPPEWFTEKADGTEPLVGDWNTYGGFPAYTTDIAAAWEVVEKVHDDEFWLKLTHRTHYYETGEDAPMWDAWFRCVRAGIRGDHVAKRATAPEAICLAALRAKGVDV